MESLEECSALTNSTEGHNVKQKSGNNKKRKKKDNLHLITDAVDIVANNNQKRNSSSTDDTDNNNERKIKLCNHGDMANFKAVGTSSYFMQSYYNTVLHPVVKCSTCSTLFGKDYKVSAKTPVHVCENAELSYHCCTFGYCKDCYNKNIIFDQNSNRKRKRRGVGT